MTKRVKNSVVHAIAICEDCDAEYSDYKTARAMARKHAKVAKHKINGETGLVFTYDGRTKEGK